MSEPGAAAMAQGGADAGREAPTRVLVAEDDPLSRRLVERALAGPAYALVVAATGGEAWRALQASDPPRLAVLDWEMPEMDGIELCRRIRDDPRIAGTHVLLLTSKERKENVVEGLSAGADDYLTKPFHFDELRARLRVGVRILGLQLSLERRVQELEVALARVKTLSGLLPICSYCKRIRQDGNYWQQVEAYVCEHSDARFSHGVCPDCEAKYIAPELAKIARETGAVLGR